LRWRGGRRERGECPTACFVVPLDTLILVAVELGVLGFFGGGGDSKLFLRFRQGLRVLLEEVPGKCLDHWLVSCAHWMYVVVLRSMDLRMAMYCAADMLLLSMIRCMVAVDSGMFGSVELVVV
jgi:hypothetical protein